MMPMEIHTAMMPVLHQLAPMAAPWTNPAPVKPDGLGDTPDTLLGNAKWITGWIVIIGGFVGVGGTVVGKIATHHKTMMFGLGIIGVTIVAAILYVAVFPFLIHILNG